MAVIAGDDTTSASKCAAWAPNSRNDSFVKIRTDAFDSDRISRAGYTRFSQLASISLPPEPPDAGSDRFWSRKACNVSHPTASFKRSQQKEVRMDNLSSSKKQDSAAEKSTGCCGGKSDAQPQDKTEPRVKETAKATPAKSGCCCSH